MALTQQHAAIFAREACESGWWEFEQWEWETTALLVGATAFRWNAPAPA